jgi:hypothetical protein
MTSLKILNLEDALLEPVMLQACIAKAMQYKTADASLCVGKRGSNGWLGWLEWTLIISWAEEMPGARPLVLGAIQRTPSSEIEFHS